MTSHQFARLLGIQAQSLHAAVCRSGGYYGIHPTKLPNGRLVWPEDAFERLTAGSHTAPKSEEVAA